MKWIVIPLFMIMCLGMWWFQAGAALRSCYLDQVEEQETNKYTGVLTSGLATKKQMELNDLVIDSYPECDEQVAEQFYMPQFGMNILVQAAQK